MKSKTLKKISLTLLLFFFVSIPFLQSFLFSMNSNGTIQINKNVEVPFLHSDKKIILLYFGYVGCQDVCSPFLMKLSKLYDSKEFDGVIEDVEIIFVNLTPEVEAFQPDLFAKFFNTHFKGIYLTKREVLNIDRNFALFFSRDLNEKSELNHTDYLYLIKNSNNTFILKNIYSTHPLEEKKLINDIILFK